MTFTARTAERTPQQGDVFLDSTLIQEDLTRIALNQDRRLLLDHGEAGAAPLLGNIRAA